jgi:hypothetical protein
VPTVLALVGLAKTRDLAEDRGLAVETVHSDLATFDLGQARWSGIVEVFCHLPQPLRDEVHRSVVAALKPGGLFVLEAYSPDQLRHGSGGPPVRELLYELEASKKALGGLELVQAREVERDVNEGKYHRGRGAVVQILARKPLHESQGAMA